MTRSRLSAALAAVVSAGLVGLVGCSEPSSGPKPNDAPIKTSEGQDKKGHKTKSMEASFEDPPKR